ncbi:MAG: TonB-dependent receptor, partial [Cyanobacteria bacterium J06632_22]
MKQLSTLALKKVTRFRLKALPSVLLSPVFAISISTNSTAQGDPAPSIEQPLPPASPAPTTPTAAQITDIQVTELEDGLQIVLITSDPGLVEVFQFQEGTTLIIDITNAALALPGGDLYELLNPTSSVAALRLEQRGDEIQLTVISNETEAPNAFLERTPEALRLDVVTAPLGETDSDIEFGGDNLRIIVAAAPLGYQVPPDASTRATGPVTVLSIPEAVIEDQGAGSLGDTLRNVSGVSTGRTGVGSRATTPIIRGFESNNILRNGLRDDTLRLGSGVNNIAQIDILKGPASVLFGAGNLGGTVNLITEVPLDDPHYEFEASVGNNALYGTSIDLTGPLDEAGLLGYRVNLAYENQSSFTDFERSEFFFISPSFQLANTERSSLIVDLEYLSSRTYGTSAGLPAVSAIGVENNSFIDTLLAGGGQISEEDLARSGTLDIRSNLGEPDLSYTETDIARFGYRLRYDLSNNWTLRNEFLGSFQETRQDSFVASVSFRQIAGQTDFNTLDRLYIDNPSRRDVFTLNSNITGRYEVAGIEQTLLLGAELSREESEDDIFQRLFFNFAAPDSEPFQIFAPNYDSERFFNDAGDINLRPGSDSTTQRQTFGLYGQLQLDFTDYLTVLLGGRFDMADQFFIDRVNRADPTPINTYDTAFSPRAGIILKPFEAVSLYASYTESFNPVIGRDAVGTLFIPERGRQFEAGLRANLLDDRLGLTLAYYDLRRSNVSTQDPNPANIGSQIQVGEQASTGFEADLVGEIL